MVQAIGVLLAVALLSFAVFNYVGDPIDDMVGREVTPEDREAPQRAACHSPFARWSCSISAMSSVAEVTLSFR